MLKVPGLKRGSRKKQPPPTVSGPVAAPQPSPHIPERPREQRPQQPPSRDMPRPMEPQQQRQRAGSQEMTRRPSNRSREPSPEIMGLTNKNYRLAKELSELRVRHREECKNVTRLTMENMNLASRCREAITHVAMLKKELARHQQRAKEALALQREQTQRIATNLSAEVSRLNQSSSVDSDAVDTPTKKLTVEMERVLAMEPPPPPPPRPTQAPPEVVAAVQPHSKPATPASAKEDKKFFEDYDSDTDEDETVENSGNGRSVLDIVDSLSDLSSPKQKTSPPVQTQRPPQVYSTPNRHRKEDRWTPHIDAAPGSSDMESPTSKLFPHSASPKVVGNSRNNHYNEEFPPDILPQSMSQRTNSLDEDDDEDANEQAGPKTSLQNNRGMITLNSIDAFEASFDTTFPSDFAAREGSERSTPRSTEIYNPFAPSPSRSERNPTAASPARGSYGSSSAMENNYGMQMNQPTSNGVAYSTPPRKTRAPHQWNNDLQYQTPPKDRYSPEESPQSEPTRPHKTASIEARARYEKALQPRTNAGPDGTQLRNDQPISDNGAGNDQPAASGLAKSSPSRLLKRIQQRRKTKEQSKVIGGSDVASEDNAMAMHQDKAIQLSHARENMAPTQSISDYYSGSARESPQPETQPNNAQLSDPMSGQPFDEEEEPFDAKPAREVTSVRPGPKSARLNALKNRRGVKQPISYAEPALNTKIRQGHNFFPKGVADTQQAQMVTPEQMTPTTA